MLLVVGLAVAPAGRRSTGWRASAAPAYAARSRDLRRALQQRNGLLRLIREEQATRDELRFWDATLLESGSAVVAERLRLLDALAEPLAAAHAEIAPEEAAAGRWASLRHQRPAPSRRDAARCPEPPSRRDRREGGVERLDAGRPAPRRRDVRLAGRDRRLRVARPAAHGDPRAKLAELDLLTALDGRPPCSCSTTCSRSSIRSGAPPRAPDRRAAPGVRDDDHARRPRSGAPLDRDAVGGGCRRRRDRPPGPRRVMDAQRPSASGGVRTGSATCCPRPLGSWGSRRSSGWRAPRRPGMRSSRSACRPPSGHAGSCAWNPTDHRGGRRADRGIGATVASERAADGVHRRARRRLRARAADRRGRPTPEWPAGLTCVRAPPHPVRRVTLVAARASPCRACPPRAHPAGPPAGGSSGL